VGEDLPDEPVAEDAAAAQPQPQTRPDVPLTAEEGIAIFVPEDAERRAKLKEGRRLVHYTTAEAAYKIITGKEVWLRNALLMNDFSDIQYGLNCLQTAWASTAGGGLQEWLDRVVPGLKEEIVSTFDSHVYGFRVATFMTSLSEHYDDEDELGRLSMWRAYGGKSGVALVLNPLIFVGATDALRAYSAPVRYETPAAFQATFEAFVERLYANEARLQRLGREALVSAFFLTFRLFVLCTKHPGFHEEREWRVFHSPLIEGGSKWLKKEPCVICGVPQEVVKLSLESDPDAGIVGLSPPELINRVIIGPSAQPLPTYHALFDALTFAEINNPAERLWMSEIPLRH
jgi:hypothetical protein